MSVLIAKMLKKRLKIRSIYAKQKKIPALLTLQFAYDKIKLFFGGVDLRNVTDNQSDQRLSLSEYA